MTEQEERAYARGRHAAYRQMLTEVTAGLTGEPNVHVIDAAKLLAQVHDAREALHNLRERLQIEVEWGDDEYLADVIDHIASVLVERDGKPG